MLNEDLSFKYLIKEPQSKKSKSPLLILLHGFGSNESDLHSFANYLPKNHYIVSIRAPFKLASGGFAWYNISFDQDMNKFNDHDQAKDSINMILSFIEELSKKYLRIIKLTIHLMNSIQHIQFLLKTFMISKTG